MKILSVSLFLFLFIASAYADPIVPMTSIDVNTPENILKPDKSLLPTIQNIEQNMIKVAGGCFQMGEISNDGNEWTKPVHEACVSSFFISKYEVTQGQWKTIMSSNPSFNDLCGDNCPVEQVSWNDAQQFIKTLNSKINGSYRLPTEAEWEYAARSGGKHEKFSGGDDVNSVAWYKGNSNNKIHPVGQKQPNSFGIYDMSGNVFEFVNDYMDKYPSDSQQNPQGPATGKNRVVRGGGWSAPDKFVEVTMRGGSKPTDSSKLLGFRLVKPVK